MTAQPYEWISADRLPPVDCPLVIKVAGAIVLEVERISFIESKDREMQYRLKHNGRVIEGRWPWSYP